MLKKAIFITIRKDSSRLPNKAIKKILGHTVTELVIKRAKLAVGFDAVIVCTTTRQIDDEIAEIATSNGALVFRGSLKDKLERWHGAAQAYGIDVIVTFDGDDLFCEPCLLTMGSEELLTRHLDFIEAPDNLICGAFTYAFTTEALAKVCSIKAEEDTEMMWTYFKDTGFFKTGKLSNVPAVYFEPETRCTLDYEEDYQFFTAIFEHFQCIDNDVSLKDIVVYLREKPELKAINYFRQAEFLQNQKNKTHLVLREEI